MAFIADAALEQGVAAGVFYIVCVGLTVMLSDVRVTLVACVAASVLTLVGHLTSPPGDSLWQEVVNRLVAMFAIWVTGALVWHQLRQTARQRASEAHDAQRLARQLVEAEEAQRKRMSREIHDALGQALTCLKLDIGWLALHLPAGQDALQTRATAMERLAARTIDEVRRLSAELRPAVLDDQGLLAAIRWHIGDFEKRWGLRCALALPDADFGWDKELSTVVYRVLQEALTNVARHAQARTVSVALWREQGSDVLLEVRDDGRGISEQEAARPHALGLRGMRERAQLRDGELTVTGVPGRGTTVLLRLPCPARDVKVDDRGIIGRDSAADRVEARGA